MTLVSENIWFMQIFAGVHLGRGVKRHWALLTTAILGDLGGYVFENFRDTATDCKTNDLEWLFHVKISFWPALLESEHWNVKN